MKRDFAIPFLLDDLGHPYREIKVNRTMIPAGMSLFEANTV